MNFIIIDVVIVVVLAVLVVLLLTGIFGSQP
jgi:hypothetical protein